MTQPPTNQNWPDWITATAAVFGFLAIPFGWITKRVFATVTRTELAEYLRQREAAQEVRHSSNTALLETIRDDLADSRERLASIEGEMRGRSAER